MKRQFSIMVMVLSLFSYDIASADTAVFGPEKYVRGTGAPVEVTKSFTVPNPEAPFRIVVQNGQGKRGSVSSGIIKLNGTPLITPNLFNKKTDVITLPVTLQGTNTITAEVRSTPGSSFIVTIFGPDPPQSTFKGIKGVPDAFPVNTATVVTFNASVPYDPSQATPLVELQSVTPDGIVLGTEGAMVDTGNLTLGDEIKGDGVFSFRKTYTIAQPGDLTLRIKATIGAQDYYSDRFALTAFTPFSEASVLGGLNAQTMAEQLYYQIEPTQGKSAALAAVVSSLKQNPLVKDAGISQGGNHVWIEYVTGIRGGISFNPPGTRGGGASLSPLASPLSISSTTPGSVPGNIAVESKKVLIASPFKDQFGSTDEGTALKKLYEDHNTNSGCPKYDITYLENSQVEVDTFKALASYGIIHVASHGNVNGNQVDILTKTPATLLNLIWYAGDLLLGRLYQENVGGQTWLAVTPSFISHHVSSMPSSLVFLGSCLSASNNTMSTAFLNAGAQAYLGFSDLVPSSFAFNKATYFHQNWVEDPSTLLTASEVFNGGCSGDPTAPACWKLIPTASKLEAPLGGLQNGNFELGTLGAWTPQGDARILTQLGPFTPTDGTYMGLISTGLGFTTSSGSISQQACLPANAQTLSVSWNFNSEEFQEYCGDIYQDFFRIDLIDSNGATNNLLYEDIDAWCSATTKVPLVFDQGDVWSTGWRTTPLNIGTYATANSGKSVTIQLSAGDIGDSIYDTAILLDAIKVQP
jgi:hypothetical protein